MSDNDSNLGSYVSENLEYLKEELEHNMEDANFNGGAISNVTTEDHTALSCADEEHRKNSRSVSDEEEDMVKLDNNDLNYDDYDEYESEVREHVESVTSSNLFQQSMEDFKENGMVGVSDSDDEGDGDSCEEKKTIEFRSDIKNSVDDCEEKGEEGELCFGKEQIDVIISGKQKGLNHDEKCELEEGEIADEEENDQDISSPTLMVSSSESSVRPKPSLFASNLNSTSMSDPALPPVTSAEPIRNYQPREKEICRFYLRGICKNGDACRFRHSAQTQVQRPRIQIVSTSQSSTLITGGGKIPIYYNNKSANIPPPTGPPISLLSTMFSPPPSASLLTRPPPPPPAAPPPPSSTESAAWMEGLKKARELARRQKGEEVLPMNESNQLGTRNDETDVDRSSLSPPLGSLSPIPIQLDDLFFDLDKPTTKNKPMPRVVVEAVSVVSGSFQNLKDITRLSAKHDNSSLVDSTTELASTEVNKGERGHQRRILNIGSGINYSDPWARSSSNTIIKGRKDVMKGRTEIVFNVSERPTKRRHRSSSSNSSGHSSQQHLSRHQSNHRRSDDFVERHSRKDEENSKSNKLKRQSSDSERFDIERDGNTSKKFRNDRDASEVSSASFNESSNIQTYINNIGKRNSRSSSSDSSDTFASLSRRSNATLGALLTHSSSSPKNNFRGPRTPPISERPESKSSSPFDDIGSRKFSVGSGHSFGFHERRHSQVMRTKIKREDDDENDDAPAAYRLSYRKNSKESNSGLKKSSTKITRKADVGKRSRSSSSSSNSSSKSSSTSTSTSSEAVKERKASKKKSLNRKQQHQKSSFTASSVSSLKNSGGSKCHETQQLSSSSLHLDELVREISGSESDCGDDDKNKYKKQEISTNLNNCNISNVLESEKTLVIKKENTEELYPTSSQDTCYSNEEKNKVKAVGEGMEDIRTQSSTKRLELLRKLQNVEQAIARQKQLKREVDNATIGEKRTKLSSSSAK